MKGYRMKDAILRLSKVGVFKLVPFFSASHEFTIVIDQRKLGIILPINWGKRGS